MDRVPNYVVAYEATEQGAEALQLGIALARLTAAELRICLVLPRAAPAPSKLGVSAVEYQKLLGQQGRDWLADAEATLPRDVAASTHVVWSESTAEGLIEAATSFRSDRIVVGASRGGILGRFTVGTVANDLLHASPVPVALAPTGYSAETIGRVTCAIGTRNGWEELIDSFAAISEDLDVDLRFVTLVEVDGGGELADLVDGEQHLERVLQYFSARSSARGSVATEIAQGTNVERGIESLDWQPGEILFVGSSRLAQPSRIFLGSTAHRMLRALPVPLVVVPAQPR